MKKLSEMTQKEQDSLSLNEWLNALEDCSSQESKLDEGFANPLTDEERKELTKKVKVNPVDLKFECESLNITIADLIEFTGTPRSTLKDWSVTQPKRIKAFLDAVRLNQAKIAKFKHDLWAKEYYGIV